MTTTTTPIECALSSVPKHLLLKAHADKNSSSARLVSAILSRISGYSESECTGYLAGLVIDTDIDLDDFELEYDNDIELELTEGEENENDDQEDNY